MTAIIKFICTCSLEGELWVFGFLVFLGGVVDGVLVISEYFLWTDNSL